MNELVKKLLQYTKNLTVLYVEDDDVIRSQMSQFLTRFFESVDTAVNGAKGLELFQQESYDIVITDINMPEKNGIEMTREMKRLKEDQIIIVTSAHTDADYLIPLIEIGVDKFCSKPINNGKFLSAIGSVTRDIYAKKEAARLEKELEQKNREMESIINLVEEAIVVFNHTKVEEVNERFLSMMGMTSKEEFIEKVDTLISLLVRKKGYTHAQTLAEFLYKIQELEYSKILLTLGKQEQAFIVRSFSPAKDRLIILMRDVSSVEKKAYFDVLTGAYNKSFLISLLREHSEEKAQRYILITTDNQKKILRWHGIKAAIQIDKKIASHIRDSLRSVGKDCCSDLIYTEFNRFIIVCSMEDVSIIEAALKKVIIQYSFELSLRFRLRALRFEDNDLEKNLQSIQIGFEDLCC